MDGKYGKYLSLCYDVLNKDIDYGKWADFYENCFEKFARIKIEKICEMACGTGSLSIEMRKRGYAVTAFDLSEQMLTLADKKTYDNNVSGIMFTLQDMCNFRVYSTVQSVICMMDGINCLLDTASVSQALKSAYSALDVGGLLIFDVNSGYKYENIYSDNAYVLEDEKVLLAWQNYYNKKSKLCDLYLTFFLEEHDGRYTRVDEQIRQRYYSEKTIRKLIKNEGFYIDDVFADIDFTQVDANKCERLIFVCRK